MSPVVILSIIIVYFLVLIGISLLTSRKGDNAGFFLANKSAPWYIVAFGMIGASLSGITFISVPGLVGAGNPLNEFGYLQMALGFGVGYAFIALVLLPIYYRLNVTSIYTYLSQRFGIEAYKTGAAYFLASRTLGASIRLLLVANVLQEIVFDAWHLPFEFTVMISILLIWVYTFRGGIKTIIWTDSLQTLFMLISLGISIYYLSDYLQLPSKGFMSAIASSGYQKIFFFDHLAENQNHFFKQFVGGIFICIGMTGLDQDMMQKNLACKNIREAQKNMLSFSVIIIAVNGIFLILGALLYMYAQKSGISIPLSEGGSPRSDLLFPLVATQSGLSIGLGVFFILGLIAAAYSSADSALTSLTTSVCVDFLDIERKAEEKQVSVRKQVHIFMSVLLFVVVVVLNKTLDRNAIFQVIYLAGYTYGPLIGLFLFGIFTQRQVSGIHTVLIALIAPFLTWMANYYSPGLTGYHFGAELILFNALLTYGGLWLSSLSYKSETEIKSI